jgi:nucleotide-binding universal stress UspA family protein
VDTSPGAGEAVSDDDAYVAGRRPRKGERTVSEVAVVCTDGSDLALHAAKAGLALLRSDATVIVVTVQQDEDYTLVSGTGMAGGVMTPEEFDALNREVTTESRTILEQAVKELGLGGVRTEILRGGPGPALCDFAEKESASVIIAGTHGRGGFKRAFLGSVSDHLVRHAPCSVLVTNAAAAE